MGSPISSIIAEAVLQRLEHVAMAQYCPKFWARYVDDTFVIIKRSQKAGFVDVLNSVCVDLQFTEEEEHQGELAFLDVLVHRQPNGTMKTRVYRKPTHTDRILHHDSNHPVAHKASCIRTLFGRVGSHCSTAKARMEEKKHLIKVCRHNGYPMRFIRRHGLSSRPPLPAGSQAEERTSQRLRITLPYISNVSEATARLLAPYDIRVAHNPNQTLRSKVMRLKDPLPTMEKSSVIYRINCEGCPANYVGETSKRVRTRIHEHKLAVRRGDQYSQIGTHMLESGHKFDFNNVQVMASDNTKGGRLLKEAWLSNEESINRHVDLCPAHVILKAWAMRDCPSGRRQHRITACPQQGGLMEEMNPKNVRTGSSQQLDNPPSAEAHICPRWTHEHINSREPAADGSRGSPRAVKSVVRRRSGADTELPSNHEWNDLKVTCKFGSSSAINSTHSIPPLSYPCLEIAGELQKKGEAVCYNFRASTRSHRHLGGMTPHRKARRSANQDCKDSASLPLRRAVYPQRVDEYVNSNKGAVPSGEEANNQLAGAMNSGEYVRITPVEEEVNRGANGAVWEIEKQDDVNIVESWAVEMNGGEVAVGAVEMNGEEAAVRAVEMNGGEAVVGEERRQRGGERRMKAGGTRKEGKKDGRQCKYERCTFDHMELRDSPDLRSDEEGRRRGYDIGTSKESEKSRVCNIETMISTRADWLGPMTRSRSRAQRALCL